MRRKIMPTVNDRSSAAFLAKLSKARITQADFAKFIGKSRRTVQRWANDDTPVPLLAWDSLDTLLQYGVKDRRSAVEKKIRKNENAT
jgi:hypothetical protein